MGLNDTPTGERVHIGFFGLRNAGKSSLVNAVTNQDLSVVSEIKGTTTDPVKKTMELLPIGPVLIIDTPGWDDSGALGEKRVAAAEKILRSCDIAVFVTTAERELTDCENELLSLIKKRDIPLVIVKNKSDLTAERSESDSGVVYTSATEKTGIEELKNRIADFCGSKDKENRLVGDLIKENDFVVLVTPIDSAAPKGRMILPQQQAIRDVIDSGAVAVTVKETELEETLKNLGKKPSLVVTDSQAFGVVSKIVARDIPLTSFSILMARYKGFLDTAIDGIKQLQKLSGKSVVLISEGCTHHRQCDDIGTVKLPKWIKNYCGASPVFEWSSGAGFPDDLSKYDLIVHCGGCMLNSNEMRYRMNEAKRQGVSFTNYGLVIAHINGILSRALEPLNLTV